MSATVVALLTTLLAASSAAELRFRENGFRVAMVTDMHYEGKASLDRKTTELVQSVLAAEKPDLVVMSGDMVSGYAYPSVDLVGRLGHLRGGPSWFERQWRRVIAPLHAAGVPYASILGNHDSEADLGRRDIIQLDIDTGGQLSLTQQGPAHLSGAGNYYLDVLSPSGSAVAARIWMLDSMSRGCNGVAAGWGCVPHDMVEWVREQAAKLPRVPSLAFIHIPIPQFVDAWNNGRVNGSKGEWSGCPAVDTGIFQVAKEFGIHAIYSGHDHYNDWIGSLEGIRLAYGRKSGFGSYGPSADMQHGVRIIELKLGQDTAESATWIRQEDGSQVYQTEVQGPKQLQPMCSLNKNMCDAILGSRLCLSIHNARNTLELVLTLVGLAAALAAVGWGAAVLRRHLRHHAVHKGWQPIATIESQPTAIHPSSSLV